MSADSGVDIKPAELEKRFLDLCERNPNGISDDDIKSEFSGVPAQDRVAAANSLLAQGRIKILKQGAKLFYTYVQQEEAAKFRGLTVEDLLVYQVIEQGGENGAWSREIRLKSNLQQNQLTKSLKVLESRRLVKSVKSITNRKVYILFNLEPSREITGGAWYSDQGFDLEFTEVMQKQCLSLIQNKGVVGLDDIAQFIRTSGISKVELRQEDFQMLVDTLIYDGKVEAIREPGAMSSRDGPRVQYRAVHYPLPENGLSEVPCGTCQISHVCTEDGVISPAKCKYMAKW
eukprot:CAMPEP_0113869576 /NCGR_PEP_ID=MMETSP0780_2-20120614/1612_1 /TAXON_ID=652834 /ORGANISM="Palpitomonas bilix" /LENGTH=287 /DNA_ID=CAMNT_0000854767 /DNA_START=108 /DNA_END=968 /DNA_ORIENTATION=+ /assembly_acc=CAM_ASM_000599